MTTIKIVFEHPDFIIIDKPIDIAVQDESNASGILPLVREQSGLDKLYLVHRLDKVTSGLLILAKNQHGASVLGKLFSSRQIEKYYLAIGSKKPGKKQGSVIGDMKKVRDGKWMLTKDTVNPAITQFFSKGLGDGTRLFLVKPRTGKTHQIRVAMKSLGSPIVGDLSYTGPASDRTYLHAFALSFSYQKQHIEVVLPPAQGVLFNLAEFNQSLDQYNQPWSLVWPQVKLASPIIRQ